ncbi:methylmalonyl Co-A mutase-associated GTPase MeaB, partial [Cutibacterium acnes]|nr:methylmalonyl Co-A mutase-associated GTPase MeaB [Cutibacterium acnes]
AIAATRALEGAEEILRAFARAEPSLPWAQGELTSGS